MVGENWIIPGDQRIWTDVQNTANFAVWQQNSLASAYPVDAIGGTIPSECYGTKLLRAAYTGPLINVENPTALVPTDIGYLPDGSINAKALWAVAGSAGYVDVDGWYGQCGTPVTFSGSIATTVLTTTASVTLVAGQVITGTAALNFGGVTPGTTVVTGGTGTSFTIAPSQTEATVEPMMASNMAYQTATANMPVMTPPDTLGNSFPVIFDGHIIGTVNSKFMSIPASVSVAAGTAVSGVSASKAEGDQEDVPIMSLIDTTNASYPLSFGNFLASNSFGAVLSSTAINTTVAPPLTPFVSGFVANNASPASFSWLDARSVNGSLTRGGLALAGGYIGKYVSSTQGAYSEQSELLIYGRALSTTDEANANAATYRYFGITPQKDACLTTNGDSITQGELTTLGQFYAAQLVGQLTHTGFEVFNAATYGTSSSQQKKFLTNAFSAGQFGNCIGLPTKIFTEFTGTNDIANVNNLTASQSGTTLTVTASPNPVGTGVNQVLTGTGVPTGETIVSQQSGTTDGVGSYTVSQSATVASETISSTATAASIYYNDQQIAALVHSYGFKFDLATMLPRTGFATTTNAAGTNEDTIRLAYNALVTSNSGGFEDEVIDNASEPTMGLQATLTNSTYYAGGTGVHPTNYGDGYIAPLFAAVINAQVP